MSTKTPAGGDDIAVKLIDVLSVSLGFVLSLALNAAFSSTFDLIPIPIKSPVVQRWLYVIIVGGLIFGALYGLFEVRRSHQQNKL
jgi:uncharacterized RDD family membrane protein YckC